MLAVLEVTQPKSQVAVINDIPRAIGVQFAGGKGI